MRTTLVLDFVPERSDMVEKEQEYLWPRLDTSVTDLSDSLGNF